MWLRDGNGEGTRVTAGRGTRRLILDTPLEYVPRAGAIHKPAGLVKFIASTIVELSDSTKVEGHEILLANGRTAPLEHLGLETVGVRLNDGRLQPDDRLRIAEGVFVAGDPAGPEMHTHLAVYQEEMVARLALGEDVRPDHRAIPRATYTNPQTAGVGLQLDEALERGHDAVEETTDYATTAPGYIAEAAGHVSIVVDRREQVLLGAFIAAPGAARRDRRSGARDQDPYPARRPGRHDPPIPHDGARDGWSVRPSRAAPRPAIGLIVEQPCAPTRSAIKEHPSMPTNALVHPGRMKIESMNDEHNRGVVERYWPAFDARDATVMHELADDDLVTEWPQSGERIVGKDNCLVVLRNYRAPRRQDRQAHGVLR
jgi:hypothetical protein